MEMYHVIKVLKNERDQLLKENERLLLQIETAEDMAHNYRLQLTKNENKIEQMEHIIKGGY